MKTFALTHFNLSCNKKLSGDYKWIIAYRDDDDDDNDGDAVFALYGSDLSSTIRVIMRSWTTV